MGSPAAVGRLLRLLQAGQYGDSTGHTRVVGDGRLRGRGKRIRGAAGRRVRAVGRGRLRADIDSSSHVWLRGANVGLGRADVGLPIWVRSRRPTGDAARQWLVGERLTRHELAGHGLTRYGLTKYGLTSDGLTRHGLPSHRLRETIARSGQKRRPGRIRHGGKSRQRCPGAGKWLSTR